MVNQVNSLTSTPPISWSHAAETTQAISTVTNLKRNAWVAEISAGSGTFTHHLIGKFKHVLAIESDPILRETAFRQLGHFPSCCILNGRPDSIDWFDNSIDLIVLAQPNRLFPTETSLKEFRRVLRPPSWFALVNTYNTDNELSTSLGKLFPQELLSAFLSSTPIEARLASFYLPHYQNFKMAFPFTISLSKQNFTNCLRLTSGCTKKDIQIQENFEPAALEIFNSFELHGELYLHMVTEIYVGQL